MYFPKFKIKTVENPAIQDKFLVLNGKQNQEIINQPYTFYSKQENFIFLGNINSLKNVFNLIKTFDVLHTPILYSKIGSSLFVHLLLSFLRVEG